MGELKPQSYLDERPAEHFDRFHRRVRENAPNWVYGLVRMVTTVPALFAYRLIARGTANVPLSGPVILAPNHFSNMDHFLLGTWIKRKIQFMAKSQMFGNPVGNFIFSHGGVFPVRRGHGDAEALITARTILERGGCLLIYAEGGRSRSGELGTPKRGLGRIALESGAPVVPVAIHGSREIRHWSRLRFPKVTATYGAPVRFEPVDDPDAELQQAASERIFADVRRLYSELSAGGRDGLITELRREAAQEPAPDGRHARLVEPVGTLSEPAPRA